MVQWVIICRCPSAFPFRPGSWSHPKIPRSVLPGDWRSAGGSMGKAEVLVLRELCCSGSSSSQQCCWGLSCSWGFRWRICNPGWRWLSPGRSIHSRRGVLTALRGRGFWVLLRDELEQGGCHGRADVLTGLGFRPSLLGISKKSWWRWPWWRGWTLLTRWRYLVGPKRFPFWCCTIWRGQTKKEDKTLDHKVYGI